MAESLTGWRLEDAMGRNVDEVFRAFHEETCEPLENPLTGSIRRVRPIKATRPVLMIRRDGNELYVESTAAPIRDGQGKVCGAVLVFHDVSESRELNRKLSYHASHDPLTGLVNRREFESRIERCLKSARALEGAYALCHLDLDQFKMINDSCGHSAGDTPAGTYRRAAEIQDPLARHPVAAGWRRIRDSAGGRHARGRPARGGSRA